VSKALNLKIGNSLLPGLVVLKRFPLYKFECVFSFVKFKIINIRQLNERESKELVIHIENKRTIGDSNSRGAKNVNDVKGSTKKRISIKSQTKKKQGYINSLLCDSTRRRTRVIVMDQGT
jgi:hypothetical protein